MKLIAAAVLTGAISVNCQADSSKSLGTMPVSPIQRKNYVMDPSCDLSPAKMAPFSFLPPFPVGSDVGGMTEKKKSLLPGVEAELRETMSACQGRSVEQRDADGWQWTW
ncbi:MAG: hypothetical protein ACF8AM_06280 [Rhodopirellula sp. JB055]|uniref:hypothetical protein n=1 Tax=Rhodopirellula sp. JB055 TaxID=3342846 RepID=UPI00370AA3D1